MSVSDLPMIDIIRPGQSNLSLNSMLTLDSLVIGDLAEPDFSPISESTDISRNAAALKQSQDEDVQRLLVLGSEAHKQGDFKLLRQHLLAALEIQPSNAKVNFNLGVVSRDAGLAPQAEVYFKHAIKNEPTKALYHQALGDLMQMMRHLLFAAQAYEAGLLVSPNHLAMLNSLTGVRQRQRMPREVAELSRRILALDPQSLSASISLTWALLWLGETEEAVDAAGRALQLDPQSLQATAMLQIASKRLGRLDAASAILSEIESRAFARWDNCATASDTFAQFEENDTAEHILRSIVAQRPDFVPALLQLGRYMVLKSNLDEGFRLMSRVVELNPEEGDAQTAVALTMIRNGDFANGWARHHWRWKRSGCEARWDLPMPLWDGTVPLDGKLLVWREQGIGDMVMYVAPAIACRERSIKTVIETNPRLVSLLHRSFPDMIVLSRDTMPENVLVEQNVVAHCPIGDLPHLLELDMENYPGRDGFLTPQPAAVSRLRERYQQLYPGKKLIGISWRSGNSSSAILRSIELPKWMPIFEAANCAFISLQYGDISKDVEQLRADHGIEVYIDTEVDAMRDMDGFAAQIAALDLVISVDNSTVHVAGALGKETWVFVPAAADWRWLKPDRHDTVWYSSVTLLRCNPEETWEPQIDLAADRLKALSDESLIDAREALYIRCGMQSFTYGDLNTAENYFRLTLAQNPTHHPSIAGLGRIAVRTGHAQDALRLLRRATEAAPDIADYHRDLAAALHAGGRLEQAYAALRKSLQLDAADAKALTLGIEIARQLDQSEEAANFCARLLRLDSEHREARLHLAQLQASAGDFDVAATNFQRVLDIYPEDGAAAFSLGCLAFRDENMEAGWAGYAHRFEAGLPASKSELTLPPLQQIWDQPEELSKARVAVRPEPGLKDQILFARWLPSLRRETNFVTAELDPRLIPLIDQTAIRLSLFPTGSLQAEEAVDLDLSTQITLADLGGKYGLDIAQLGASGPYLRVNPDNVATLRRDYLSALGARRLVGLCWRGSDMAIPLKEWLPILQLEEFGFVSLQAGPAQQELHEVFDSLSRSAIRDPSIDPQTNLRGFATQMAAVDLVISIDEVPVHLAGALGIPTICLLPEVADWRWFGAERTDSPWYPTMRLYRQTTDSTWSDVMSAIAVDLRERIAQNGQEKVG